MNDDTLDALRRLLLNMQGNADAGRTDHLTDAIRLIKAFMSLEDSESRQIVIDTAERLLKKKA